MSLVRRVGSANALYAVLALIFPPLEYVPGGALAAVMVVVGGIWTTNHFWAGPTALSAKRQQVLADSRLNLLRGERMELSLAEGRLAEPPERWLDGPLRHPGDRVSWSVKLARVRVHSPQNRLSPEASAKVLRLLQENWDDATARRFALLVFRVGGAPKELYRYADQVTDPSDATYLFDALETRQLLADKAFWGKHEARRVKPWAPKPYVYAGGAASGDHAFGVFRDDSNNVYVRAAGDRAPEDWRNCQVAGASSSWAYLSWNGGGHPDFGAQFFRMNEIRTNYRDEPGLVHLDRRYAGSGFDAVHLQCPELLYGPELRLPAKGEIALY